VRISLGAWGLVPAALAAAVAGSPPSLVVFSGPTMGTRYTVKVVMRPGDEAEDERIREAITRELDLANDLLSTWNAESEISRFNRHHSTEPFAVAPETLDVLRRAIRVSELTAGAFDVTVDPLVEAWGFGPEGRRPEPPSPEELRELREHVGFRLLRLDPKERTVTKLRPDVACDLSALVPGWTADRIVAALAALGHSDVIVDLGGEVAARGRRADGERWRVAVASPGSTATTPVLELEDMAVATSGDYRNVYTDAQGRLRSHLIDPRTGKPVAHGLASVTVVHREASWADALATGLLVLGPEDGPALARREHLAARFVVRQADGTYAATATPQFAGLVLGEVRR
jgi:thiamine biosynthesis lipoprotein